MRNRRTRSYPTLQTWREAQQLNQRRAADLLGISQTTYGLLERRRRFVKGEQAKAIMDKTGVPLEVLVGVA